MQAYFGSFPHQAVLENLDFFLDNLSGFLDKVVCVQVELDL